MRVWTVTALVLVAAVGVGCSGPKDPVADDRSWDAAAMCEQFIGRRLKAPGSAEYPRPEINKGGDTYTVTGVVDSQNSFGAQVRSQYVCTIRDTGDDRWTLVDLDLSSS